VNIAEATHARFIIVAFGNQANRSVDYVPVNTCTPQRRWARRHWISFVRN
jgi:hypothetical protein